MTIFTWHCWGPCRVGDDVFGLDFFTVTAVDATPAAAATDVVVFGAVATTFSLTFVFNDWLRFTLLLMFPLPMPLVVVTGTVVTVTVPLLCTELLLATLPTIEKIEWKKADTNNDSERKMGRMGKKKSKNWGGGDERERGRKKTSKNNMRNVQ